MMEFTDNGTTQRLLNRISKLYGKIEDMTPVWQMFLPYYRDLVRQNFASKGKLFNETSWPDLSPKYKAWKKKNYPGVPMMALTYRLINAALGQTSEGYEKIGKDTLEIGITGIPYSDRHQKGLDGMPQRPYLYYKDENNKLPRRGWNILIKMMNEYLEKEDDENEAV